jgi:hypothetical protein
MLCLLAAHPAAAHASADQTAMAACRALVLDYAYYRDRYDANGYANLFAEHAVLSILGVDYEGRAAIKARLLENRDRPVIRHHMSTIKIFAVDAATARGVSYVTVYMEPATGELPVTSAGFTTIGEYHDTFERTDTGWKIARRDFKQTFVPPLNAITPDR